VLVPFLWPLASHTDTMAHEGAHAAVGSAMGFTVLGVTMDRESGGATYLGPGSSLRWLPAAFAGYLGPSGFGLCAAKLIETGHAVCVPWVAAILLVLLLFLVRKSFGAVSVPAAIALLSGVRSAVAHGTRAEDAGSLSAVTHLPRWLWAALWIAGTLVAVATGGKWLVLRS
jgi:hypothetical protein